MRNLISIILRGCFFVLTIVGSVIFAVIVVQHLDQNVKNLLLLFIAVITSGAIAIILLMLIFFLGRFIVRLFNKWIHDIQKFKNKRK